MADVQTGTTFTCGTFSCTYSGRCGGTPTFRYNYVYTNDDGQPVQSLDWAYGQRNLRRYFKFWADPDIEDMDAYEAWLRANDAF